MGFFALVIPLVVHQFAPRCFGTTSGTVAARNTYHDALCINLVTNP